MISIELIKEKLEDLVKDTSKFLVDVQISANNDISIEIDDSNGFIAVEDCIAVSKGLENELDRDEEDFSLQVGSPGLSNPFKVKQQYIKNVGREVKVLKADGMVLKGTLSQASENSITLESKVKERIEGRKAKQWTISEVTLDYNEIKETTIIISFK